MKYITEAFPIVVVSFIGEILEYLIPLPIPASIYGLCLMLVLLSVGAVRVSSVGKVAHILVDIMPLTFIAPAVGLISVWDLIRSRIAVYAFMIAFTTLAVMLLSGRVTQRIIRRKDKER